MKAGLEPCASPNLGRLSLGTATLGMDYGATNTRGRIPSGEFEKILNRCRAGGIRRLDTAQSYGPAEELLGRFGVADFLVTTKFTLRGAEKAESVLEKARASLKRLRTEKLGWMLLHNEERLEAADGEAVASALQSLKTLGLVEKVGISSYEPVRALELCKKHGFDVVQLPVNVLDTRLLQDDILQRFLARGIEVQARSVFLQGILLDRPLPGKGVPTDAQNHAEAFRARCREESIPPLEAALGYVLGLASSLNVVFGITAAEQLEQVLQVAASPRVPRRMIPVFWKKEFDPRFWKS